MNRRSAIRRSSGTGNPGTAEQKATFKHETFRRAAGVCAVTDDGAHAGPLQAHHVITKEAIKGWWKTRHLRTEDLADALWEPGNGLLVCERHHARHTNGTRRIPRAVLPDTAVAFARSLGLDHHLDRYYREETDAA